MVSKILAIVFCVLLIAQSPLDVISAGFYRAIVVSVYDADTITCDIIVDDNPLWKIRTTFYDQDLRLMYIDAPEVRGTEKVKGFVSRDSLRSWIHGREVLLQMGPKLRDKYGRPLCVVWLDTVNINQKLVDAGLALPASY